MPLNPFYLIFILQVWSIEAKCLSWFCTHQYFLVEGKYCCKEVRKFGETQQESGQHKKTRGWWRWRWRGKPPLACSISACLNRPVRSRRLKQMQMALTCLQKKKKNPEGFSNQLALTMVGCPVQGGCTVWALNGTMCERGAVKQRLGTLRAAELILRSLQSWLPSLQWSPLQLITLN